MRDLIIVQAVPDAAQTGLLEVADDQAQRLREQAKQMGAAEVTRAAEIIADGLTQMRGTTTPRLHLELMCARVLLPAADLDDRGLLARIDQLERSAAQPQVRGSAPMGEQRSPQPQTRPAAPMGEQQPPRRPSAPPTDPEPAQPQTRPAAPLGEQRSPQPQGRPEPRPTGDPRRPARPVTQQQPSTESRGPEQPAPQLNLDAIQQAWPQILEMVKAESRYSWLVLSQYAQVRSLSGNLLVLSFENPGAKASFLRGTTQEVLERAIMQVLRAQLRIEASIANEAPAAPAAQQAPAQPAPMEEDEVSPDDETVDDDLSATELLARELGAEVIDEQ